MPPRKSMPKGWLDYTYFKTVIAGTRIIPFKTPLKEHVFLTHPVQKWTPLDVIKEIPNLGIVINLCFNHQNPYYMAQDFENNGISCVSIPCMGHEIPKDTIVKEFISCVNTFLSDQRNDDKVVGVHCTHGVNRTGYVVCRYLIDTLRMKPQTAMSEFERARGHAIERELYINDLCNDRTM